MIDARDPAVAAPSAQSSRRSVSKLGRRSAPNATPARKALPIPRVFSDENVSPFDEIEWDRRTAEITDDSGKVIFKQENVEVPKSWSGLATKGVVLKYFFAE